MRISLTTLIHVLYDIFSWVWILIWFLFVCVVATSVCRFLYLSHDPCHLQPRSAHPLVNRHHGDRVLYKNYFLCWRAGLQSIQRIGVCVCVCVFNDPMLSLSQPDKPHPYSSSDVIYNAHKLTHAHTHTVAHQSPHYRKKVGDHTRKHTHLIIPECVCLWWCTLHFLLHPQNATVEHTYSQNRSKQKTPGGKEKLDTTARLLRVLLKDRGTLQRFAGPCGGSGWNSSLSTPPGAEHYGHCRLHNQSTGSTLEQQLLEPIRRQGSFMGGLLLTADESTFVA